MSNTERAIRETSVATIQMIDSAYPDPPDDSKLWGAILVYAGGDTPHPWTRHEIMEWPARYRLPTWVRSDPQDANGLAEAALFVAWLHGMGVPMGTAVCLDLETAVNAPYVDAFNLGCRLAGYKVVKYGSQGTIWQNPRTDGGTFVASPGPDQLTGEGDEVARQYAFLGTHDVSIVKASLPLWDVHPLRPSAHRYVVTLPESLDHVAGKFKTTPDRIIWETSIKHPNGLGVMEAHYIGRGDWSRNLYPGTILWLP